MSTNSSRSATNHHPEHPSRAMQWAVLIILTCLTFLVLVLPIIAAYVTKNVLCFLPTVGAVPLGFIWHRVANYTFPKRKEDLEEMKIQYQHRRLHYENKKEKH